MYGYLVQFIYDNNINHVIIYLLITKIIIRRETIYT
jgi:hypothetical protein